MQCKEQRSDAYTAKLVQAMGGRKMSVANRRKYCDDSNFTANFMVSMAGKALLSGMAIVMA